MKVEGPNRVFAIGVGVFYPYQSKPGEFILIKEQITEIIYDIEGSMVGVLPPERRDPNKPNGGATIGDYFDSDYVNDVSPVERSRIVKRLVPNTGWQIPKKLNTIQEAIGLTAALRALDSAGITPTIFDETTPWRPKGETNSRPLRVAVGVTNSLGPLELQADAFRRGLDPKNLFPLARGGLSGHTNTAIITAINSQGPSILHQAACATALFNFNDAYRYLRDGEAELAIAGGFEVAADPLWIYILAFHKAIADYTLFQDDPRKAPSPGGNNPSGLAFTEGGSCVIFATEETISRLNIPPNYILAEMIAGKTGQDNIPLVPPDPPRELPRVMKEALSQAGLSPADIQVLIPHATGTRDGERHDLESARDTFNLPLRDLDDPPDDEKPGKPFITDPKSKTGHNMAGSGGLSILTACDIFRRQEIPLTRNVDKPNGLVFNLVYGRNKTAPVEHIMVTAVGMDGTTAAVIFERPPESLD